MPQTLYYVQLDNEHFGPFALETIIDMHLTPDVLVLSSDTNQWKEAVDYIELIDSLDISMYDTDMKPDNLGRQIHDTTPPPFNERSIFYILRGDNPYGPYTLEALASVPVSETTDVSLDGMVTWYKIGEITGLLDALAAIRCMGMEVCQPPEDTVDRENEVSNIDTLLNQIRGLVPTQNQPYRKVFETSESERDFLINEYNEKFNLLVTGVRELALSCRILNLSRRALSMVSETVNDAGEGLNRYYTAEISRLDASNPGFTKAAVTAGHTDFILFPPLENIYLCRIDYLTVLGDKNLCVTYDTASEENAAVFINSIIGRLYQSNAARLIDTIVVDTDYMTGLDDAFKLLNRDLYKVISRTDEVRDTLKSLQERASQILRNLLVEKGSTLRDYNRTHESKETNILLVLKNFPHGLNTDNLENLWRLATVGPKVGIYVVILTSRAAMNNMAPKEIEVFDPANFIRISNHFHLEDKRENIFDAIDADEGDNILKESQIYDTLPETELRDIVKEVNSKCELREDVVVSISDYLPQETDWWRSDSAKQIDIPFGLGGDMQMKSLKITQESGQNTAVVIGIPGSGKSVFLHSLICSAAVRYSPDELRMYLIDFSGVEFNSYALGKLPHARVIAPEAEREFGLSILNELVEEGSRRMALCRDHNVSNIVDLKRVAPQIKIPRLLVIIDEFQKLFEVDNDPISKEANSKIHIIIQEFRKFGINLILATQKLPTSSFLPRDLIANRVVFKSSPADFDSLISVADRSGMPRLRTGQCVYNSESGAPYANEVVQGFYTSKPDLDALMDRLRNFEKTVRYEREPMKVFRSADLPVFDERRVAPMHNTVSPIPLIVPVYFGESIAVSDVDVSVELVKENANNILIIGGEGEIARNITFNAMRSAVAAHSEGTAKVAVISGLRADNPMNGKVQEFADSAQCDFAFASTAAEVSALLKTLKEVVERRRNDETVPQQHIYVTCFDFQSIRALDKDTSGSMPKLSQAAKDMDMIIRNGASVGVFVILQTDTLDSLNRASQSSLLPMFNFRVALQMSEDLSYKIIGTPLANKLFVFNRPASRFRGYVRDNIRNQSIKFKPYKL